MNDILNQSLLIEQKAVIQWNKMQLLQGFMWMDWKDSYLCIFINVGWTEKPSFMHHSLYYSPCHFRVTKMDSLCRGRLSSIIIIHAWNKANPINLEPEFPFSIIYLNIFMCVYKSCNFSLIKSTMSWHWFSCHT